MAVIMAVWNHQTGKSWATFYLTLMILLPRLLRDLCRFLQGEGMIERIGSKRNGRWIVIKWLVWKMRPLTSTWVKNINPLVSLYFFHQSIIIIVFYKNESLGTWSSIEIYQSFNIIQGIGGYMRILLISDIHSNIEALKAILNKEKHFDLHK